MLGKKKAGRSRGSCTLPARKFTSSAVTAREAKPAVKWVERRRTSACTGVVGANLSGGAKEELLK